MKIDTSGKINLAKRRGSQMCLLRNQLLLFLLLGGLFTATAQSELQSAPQKRELISQGKRRTFYVYVPPRVATAQATAPLLLLFHGSGQNGLPMIQAWRATADKAGIILAAPDAADAVKWSIPADAPAFIYDLVEQLKRDYKIDARRVYLFGFSAGSGFAINLSLLESEYFAAAAVYASATYREQYLVAARRKTPFVFFAGTKDKVFPVAEVRQTRERLSAKGFTVDYHELNGQSHNYFAVADSVNAAAWEFLCGRSLPAEPIYDNYNFKN